MVNYPELRVFIMQTYGLELENEGFLSNSYIAYGSFMYMVEDPEIGWIDYIADFTTQGTVHFNPVPEPATLFLLAFGFAGLAVLKKKY
jgi:hypothetical protein